MRTARKEVASKFRCGEENEMFVRRQKLGERKKEKCWRLKQLGRKPWERVYYFSIFLEFVKVVYAFLLGNVFHF